MMGIAAGGLAVNLIGLWILNAGKGESLNVRPRVRDEVSRPAWLPGA